MTQHPLVTYFLEKSLSSIPAELLLISTVKILDDNTLSFVLSLFTENINLRNLALNKENTESLKILKCLKLIEKHNYHIRLVKEAKKGICIVEWNLWFENNNDLILHNQEKNIRVETGYEKYEEILNLIVNKKCKTENLPIKKLLCKAEIIDYNLEITNKGFEFLLKSKTEQLWILIFTIINSNKQEKDQLIEILLEMSLLKEKIYFLKKENDGVFRFFEMIGLVVNLECEYKNYKENQIQGFCSTDKNTKFNKNSLITKAVKITDFFKFLFSKETTTNLDFLIIEANFKFYAKTTLEHQKSILKLFTSTKYELPGFVIGQLSEESVNDAFSRGITAKQITHYIKSISKNIPDVVIEQIQIWEEKKNRLKSFECIMLSGFLKAGDFKKVADFCKNKIYTNEEKRILFIKIEEFEMIKEFIKKLNL